MQVAVAGVEDVADAQPDRARERGCARAPRAASCAARRRPARSSSATRGPSPQTRPCVPSRCARAARRLRATLDRRRAGAAADVLDHGEQLAHFGGRPVELDDQDRVGGRKVRMHGRFGGLDGQRIHHLDGRRDDARADDLGDRGAAAHRSVERRQQRLHRSRACAGCRTIDLRDDRQRAFGCRRAGPAGRVRAHRRSGLPMCTSSPSGSTASTAEHVVHGEAVLQAVRAAGVLGDVAADRADLLARGIGRVVVTERRHLPGDLEVGHAGFDGHAAVGDVDVEHAIQPRQRDDDAAGHRQRSARQARSRARAHERNPVLARTERTTSCTCAADDGQHDRPRATARRCGSASHS